MDQGLFTGAIFLDSRKAFDVVNHDLLVAKLQMYDCSSSALLWFKSYLSDRRQCVNIAGTLSWYWIIDIWSSSGLNFEPGPLPPSYQRPAFSLDE